MATSMEQEILGLENEFWRAMQEHDGPTAEKLSDDSCIVVGPQGIGRMERATIGKMVESPADWELRDFDLGKDGQVREIAPGVIVSAYKVDERLMVDGEERQLEAYDTSVWVKKDGGWVCAMHTETLAGDPFGRDMAS